VRGMRDVRIHGEPPHCRLPICDGVRLPFGRATATRQGVASLRSPDTADMRLRIVAENAGILEPKNAPVQVTMGYTLAHEHGTLIDVLVDGFQWRIRCSDSWKSHLAC
jgi:hypothetical protein